MSGTGEFKIDDLNLKTILYVNKKPFKYLTKSPITSKIISYLLAKMYNKQWHIIDFKVTQMKKSPKPPYITSTLQTDVATKLRWPIKKIMDVAQKLYEKGYITYMRTDSLNLCTDFLDECKPIIENNYGPEYYSRKQYETSDNSAQEAHEAIRPQDVNIMVANDLDVDEQKLYSAIWNRAVASQMSQSIINCNHIYLSPDKNDNFMTMVGTCSTYEFKGYTILYNSSSDIDDETQAFNMHDNSKVELINVLFKEKVKMPPTRYNEASLVAYITKKGIGRPSTFVQNVHKVQEKGYVENKNIDGKEIKSINISFDGINIVAKLESTFLGKENERLVPTKNAIIINDFLCEYFPQIMDISFTAKLEKDLDLISCGKIYYKDVLTNFYTCLKKQIDTVMDVFPPKLEPTDDVIGYIDNNPIIYLIGKFGPAIKYKDIWVNVKIRPELDVAIGLIKEKENRPKPVIVKELTGYIVKQLPNYYLVQHKGKKGLMCKQYRGKLEDLTLKKCKELFNKK